MNVSSLFPMFTGAGNEVNIYMFMIPVLLRPGSVSHMVLPGFRTDSSFPRRAGEGLASPSDDLQRGNASFSSAAAAAAAGADEAVSDRRRAPPSLPPPRSSFLSAPDRCS